MVAKVSSLLPVTPYIDKASRVRLIKAAADNRHGHRDATMILLASRLSFQ